MYFFIYWLAARSARWFYRHREIAGAGLIPESGATMLVASHGNDLPDILLTLLVTGRRVRFVANIAAANSIIGRFVYETIGVIPIARLRDARAMITRGEDVAALNARAFVQVSEALQRGECVAIFPEGIVNDLPHLSPIQTGAARMALDAAAAFASAATGGSAAQSLSLVAIGFQYENSQQWRTDCISVVGTPMRVDQWKPMHAEKAASEFTRVIQSQLQQVTRNAATPADARALNSVAAAVGAVTCNATRSALAASHDAQLLLTNARSANGLFVAASNTSSAAEFILEQAAGALTNRLVAFRASPWSSIDHAVALKAAGHADVSVSFASVARLLVLAPVALTGWLYHAVPFWAAHAQGRRFAPRPVEVAARTIMPGLYLIALWYVTIPLALLLAGISPWLVLTLLLCQPWLGDVALQWRDGVRERFLILRVRRAPLTERLQIISAANELRRLWHALHGAARAAQQI
ncbi:MAG: 1-acyl-sn-glycerol-3-phosphate acyltransferase [Gemmatimonadota bacterium]|nr:1-acyl-sn-glycerol-3-phosphate acyltransferase [Gemmatimonadota bacterium]